jgi:uncharacterized protein YukE
MINKIATRIQSRLSRKGIKVTLGDIKNIYSQTALDPQNPTEQEIINVMEHFISNATKLTLVNEDNATEVLTEVEEIFSSVDSAINTASIQDIDSSILHTNEAALDTEEEIVLATATKSELVASTANSLGVVLNTSEIELIASNFNSSSEDLTDSLEEIKSAIVAFIQYKVSLNSQKISETLEEISQVAADGFSQNSEQLTTGLQGINSQLQEQSRDFKSKVKSTLAAFKVPSLKAG